MDQTRFQIVFQKLEEAAPCEGEPNSRAEEAALRQELDEIDELRRVLLEVLDEPVMSYTTT